MPGPWDQYAVSAAPAAIAPPAEGPWLRYQPGAPTSIPQEPEETWGQYGAGLARSAAQGLTFNTADEIEAYIRSKLGGQPYDKGVEAIRRENAEFAGRHPVESVAATIAGGVPLFALGPGAAAGRWVAGASSLPRMIGRSASLGAGIGAASGAGAGEGNPLEGDTGRLWSGLEGAGLGAGIGAAVPPVLAGASRMVNATARSIAPRSYLGGRAQELPPGEPPIPPRGAQYEPGGQQAGRLQWVDNRNDDAAINSMDRAIVALADQLTRAGIPRDVANQRLADFWKYTTRTGQPAAYQYHSNSFVPGSSTLAEIFPEFQEILGAATRQNPEVRQAAEQFFQARQTGMTPQGGAGANVMSQRDLAERGVPTVGRFEPPVMSNKSQDVFGRQFGPSSTAFPVSTSARDRFMEGIKRWLNIQDSRFHGHAGTPEEQATKIIAERSAAATPNYNAAMDWADSNGVNLSPSLRAVMDKWSADPEMRVPLFRRALRRISREFVDEDTGQPVSSLRSFDTAKKAADDLIGKLHQDNLGNVGGRMTDFKNDLLAAVDKATERTPGGNDSLYREARNVFSSATESRNIMNAYRDLVTGAKPDSSIRFTAGREHFSTLSPENQKLAKEGIVWGFRELTHQTDFSRKMTGLFNNPRMNELVESMAPGSGTHTADLAKLVNMEEEGRRAYQRVLGGSQTAQNIQSDAAFEALQSISNIKETLNLLRGSTGILDSVGKLIERVSRQFGMNADMARDTGRMLLTADPHEQMRIMQRVLAAMPSDRRARFAQIMQSLERYISSSVSTASGAAAMAQPQQQPSFL